MTNAPIPTWWLHRNNATEGPFTHAYISLALQNTQLDLNCLACLVGTQEWKTLADWGQWSERPTTAETFAFTSSSQRVSDDGQLPDTARWICNYGLFVMPILWVVNNLSCVLSNPLFVEQSPYFGLELLLYLVDFPITLAATITLFVGALKLRRSQQIGRTLVLCGLGGHVAWTMLLLMAGIGLLVVAESDPHVTHLAATESSGMGDALGCGILLAAFGFEIFAFIWLGTAGKRLKLR